MPITHIVAEGDCVESIAYQYGFFRETIWNDSQNSELKRLRKDPHVLLPGDKVQIMDKRRKEICKEPEQRHQFKRKGIPLHLKVHFANWRGEPHANLAYRIDVDGKLGKGKTDGDGNLKHPIAPDAVLATLIFANGLKYQIDLGRLAPVTEPIGLQQRLTNLGFYHGPLDGVLNPETSTALAAFQIAEGLNATGKSDLPTQDQLVKMNGN